MINHRRPHASCLVVIVLIILILAVVLIVLVLLAVLILAVLAVLRVVSTIVVLVVVHLFLFSAALRQRCDCFQGKTSCWLSVTGVVCQNAQKLCFKNVSTLVLFWY